MSRYTAEHSRSFFSFLAVLLALALVPAPHVYAGNATFEAGAFNFCVSVRFNATAAQLAQIRTAFQNGSDVLLDATDGQHRFGRITIVNDSGASQSAEYWVNAGAGRAYATVARYGFRGEHVNLFFDSNFQAVQGADGDAYTIAHEHAHHAYGVLDEYSGPGLPCTRADRADCAEDAPLPDTATLNFSLMDDYLARGGRAFPGMNYTLNEFCVNTNHDPDRDTWQEKQYPGQSTWETIAAQTRFPATAPAGLPVDASPASQPVTFVDGFGGLRVMLLLDRSGSMAIEQRLVFAKLGANLFVNFVRTGDELGVASFADTASVNFPLTAIVGSGTQAAARTAINSLVASGATNIGGGLLAALGQITAQTQRSCNEIIVLLSDGDHNTGPPPRTVIPALRTAGVTVLTVGVGSNISTDGEMVLRDIATQTGGKFFRVASAFDLVGLFLRLVFESIGGGLLTRAPEVIASGETKEIPVLVETGTVRATFAVAFANTADVIMLSLQTPSGDVITQADVGIKPGVAFIAEPNTLVFQINAPEAGIWKMVVTAGAITTGILEALAFAEHDGVQLNVAAAKDMLTFPEPVELQATPLFEGENVLEATITGTVMRPDGSQVPIILHDDGLAINADAMPGDGIYSARFNNYSQDGTYTFELTMTSTNGVTYAGETLFLVEPSNAKSVPTFTRTASTTVVITGVPSVIPVSIDIEPGQFPNRIHISQDPNRIEMTTVAILTTSTFDATTVDPTTVRFGKTGTKAAPVQATVADANGDGVPDLVLRFRTQDTGLQCGDTSAVLTGQTVSGQAIQGSDSIVTVRGGVICP